MSILSIQNVVKRYHSHTAVDNLSFEVPKGIIYGLLGPNGAGKTSLIRIITTITRADEGQVLLDGSPVNEDTPLHIGYMPEERGLYKKMKVADHLLYLAELRGLPRKKAMANMKYWFDKFDISSWHNKRIEELSKGMQQKIQFIATVIHEPKLLILDEPFSGLDPINSNLIRDEIYALNQKGTSIIFSTHRMEQVEEICEEIILMNNGRKVLEGNVDDIKEQNKNHQYKVGYYNSDISTQVRETFDILEESDHHLVIQGTSQDDSNAIITSLINKGLQIKSFEEILPSINDIFIQKVGETSKK